MVIDSSYDTVVYSQRRHGSTTAANHFLGLHTQNLCLGLRGPLDPTTCGLGSDHKRHGCGIPITILRTAVVEVHHHLAVFCVGVEIGDTVKLSCRGALPHLGRLGWIVRHMYAHFVIR